MKSLIIALVMATLSGAVPIAEPQTTEAPTLTTASSPAPTTASSLLFSPTSLADYQHPVVLPNGVECIAPYLVMSTSENKPSQALPQTAQIGPNVFIALHFNSTHQNKTCRFHFAFSNLADGGNGVGTEDVYALQSGGVDEALTFQRKPRLEPVPIASFNVTGSKLVVDSPGSHEMYPFVTREDFPCPTANTGWGLRGSNGSYSNWSWNHGLVVEVLGDNPWVGGNAY